MLIKMIRFLFLIPLTIFTQNDYYSSCYGLLGNELKQELSNTIDNHIYYSYNQVKDILRSSDEDPQNQDNIILVYTGNSINKESFASNNQQDFWNREHVWPKSHGDFGPGDQYSIPAFTDVLILNHQTLVLIHTEVTKILKMVVMLYLMVIL